MVHAKKSKNSHGFDQFYMPAEWSEHERTWMAWPSRKGVWGNRFKQVKKNYADVAQAIRRFEPVTMVVNKADEGEAKKILGPDIDVQVIPIDDSWTRDSAPCFLINNNGELGGIDFNFNAWGGKYSPYDKDNELTANILKAVNAKRFVSELTAEGGAVTVDGEGTLITTESCLLNTNRNPGWTKFEVEAELKSLFGVSKIIWLPGNRAETETDGHVDGIAAFMKPGVVMFEINPDPFDDFADILHENRQALEGQTDAKGRPLDIVLIEEAASAEGKGERFCRSYINFLFTNGGIVMPRYGIPEDDRAKAVFAHLFPEREIVQVDISEIAVGGGGIHCITQQQPKRT